MLQNNHIAFASIALNLCLLSVLIYHTWPNCTTWTSRSHMRIIANTTVRVGKEGSEGCGNPLVAAKEKFFKLLPETISDKFTSHTYQFAYYKYLYPFTFGRPKMLEIGLGCNMPYKEGASVTFWKKYFQDKVDLWIFEADTVCVDRFKLTPNSTNVGFSTGDQANVKDLTKLIDESGGEFDIIVDDGGHETNQQMTSLKFLFGHLKSGGIYFVEDISRHENVDPLVNMQRRVILNNVQKPLNDSQQPVVDPNHLLSMDCYRELCVFSKV